MRSINRRSLLRNKVAFVPTDSFIITVNIANDGDSFTLPLITSGSYNFDVDWGDLATDQITTYNQAEVTHTYATAGSYDIDMNGIIENISFLNSPDKNNLLEIKQWGSLKLIIERAFDGCSNLDVTATDIPDLSMLTTISRLFSNCSSLIYNSSIADWDVSQFTDFSGVFQGCSIFNKSLSDWNLSAASNISLMFLNASNFNNGQDANINNWDVSNVSDMNSIFQNSSFNQDIGNWDVSNVTNMRSTFQNSPFNQDISNWVTSSLTFLRETFAETNFNQDISSWNTSSIFNMFRCFRNNSVFNQNLDTWNIEELLFADEMFLNGGLSTTNYDALLIGWEAQNVKNDVLFDAGNTQYTAGSAAETARAALIADHNWTITDGGGI